MPGPSRHCAAHPTLALATTAHAPLLLCTCIPLPAPFPDQPEQGNAFCFPILFQMLPRQPSSSMPMFLFFKCQETQGTYQKNENTARMESSNSHSELNSREDMSYSCVDSFFWETEVSMSGCMNLIYNLTLSHANNIVASYYNGIRYINMALGFSYIAVQWGLLQERHLWEALSEWMVQGQPPNHSLILHIWSCCSLVPRDPSIGYWQGVGYTSRGGCLTEKSPSEFSWCLSSLFNKHMGWGAHTICQALL